MSLMWLTDGKMRRGKKDKRTRETRHRGQVYLLSSKIKKHANELPPSYEVCLFPLKRLRAAADGTAWRKARRWRSGELFYPRGLSCSEATNMIDNRRQDGAPHRRRAKGGGAAVRQYPRNEGRRRPTHRPPSAVRRPRSLKVHSATARGLTLIAASTSSPAARRGF